MNILLLTINLSMVLWTVGLSWDMYTHDEIAWLPVNLVCSIYWLDELVQGIKEANKTSWWL